jgi:quinol monooxygenase YgiN
MIGLEMIFKIHPEKRSEFLLAIDMMKEAGHLEENRIGMQLFEQVTESNTFLWLEHWEDTEVLNNYCNQNKFRALMGAIDILGKIIHKRTHLITEETSND